MTEHEMTGGDAIVESLARHDVDVLFGMPGVQTYELFDALQRRDGAIRVVSPRHEQAAAYMAFGYAQATGRPGIYSVVPGPGVLNAGAALCSAYGASTPIMCLTGEVPAGFIGSGKGHLHELPDQLGLLRGLTKWAARIDAPCDAPRLVAEAFRQMASGRPRPVALEMPWDVFGQRQPVCVVEPLGALTAPAPDDEAVELALRALRSASNPMIMVGSGALEAAPEILELAERLQAPVVSFRGGRGVVSDDHHLGFTCAAGFRRWAQTDVLLGIGSRLELQWFRWPDQPAGLATITIDIDPSQAQRLNPDVALVGDSGACVRSLLAGLPEQPRSERRQEFEEVKAETERAIQEVSPYVQLLAAIREALPRDGFLVEEICQAGFTSYYGFPVYAPRTFVTCGHQGTLGFGFPTALGVKVAHPDRAVVSITGDGGFQFGLQELATAMQYGIDLVTVVFNNNAYGNVVRDQQRLFDGRLIASELRNPDFVALSRSYGVHADRVTQPVELRNAIAAAIDRGGPAVIEVAVPGAAGTSPWQYLMPAGRRRG